MKTSLFLILGLVFTATVAQAEPYVGGSFGYLTDSEEEFFTGRFGYVFSSTDILSNGVEVELGYAGREETVFDTDVDVDVVPLMVNYRGEVLLGGPLSAYFGAGLGVSFVEVDVEDYGSADDEGFTAQAFAGLVYELAPNFHLTGGIRYIYINEVSGSIAGVSAEFDDLDDFGFEIGVSVSF